MEEGKKRVLLLLPPKDIYIKDLELKYSLHTLPEEKFNMTYLEDSFNVDEYIERAIAYVKEHNIEGVFALNCFGSLIQAIVVKQTGLLGPSFDSVLFCVHKYFGRTKQPYSEGFWFESLDPTAPLLDIKNYIKTYPLFIKICDGQYGQKTAVCQSEDDLPNILKAFAHPKLIASSVRKQQFYFKHIEDFSRFPGINTPSDIPMFMMESCLQDITEHCLEFWVSEDGKFNAAELTDILLYEDRTIKAFTTSFQLDKKEILAKIWIQFGEFLTFLREIGLKNLFIDLEFFVRSNGELQIVEINSRRAQQDFFKEGLLGVPELDLVRQSAEVCVGGRQLSTLEEASPGKIGWDFPIYVWEEGMIHKLLDLHYLSSLPNVYWHLYANVLRPIARSDLVLHSRQCLAGYIGLVTHSRDEGFKLIDEISAKARKIL